MTIYLGKNVINVVYTKYIGNSFVFYPLMWLLYLRGKVTTFCMMTINLTVPKGMARTDLETTCFSNGYM